MKVFLTSAYPYHPERNFAMKWLKESAISDPFKDHRLADGPQEADLILFVEHHPGHDPYFFSVYRNEIYRKFKEKCFLYHDCDWAIPVIPGIFPSVEKRLFTPGVMQAGHYIARLCENEAIKPAGISKKEYLFSFVGARKTHICRSRVLNLQHDRCYLKDTSGMNSWKLRPEDKKKFEEDYVNVSAKSQFILCPRGIGPNTYRLFEAMEMGIAPVIISDEWVPIEGPSWERFSLKIAENDIGKIPNILEEHQNKSLLMGMLAREEWKKWFSKEVSFHRLIEACGRIQEERLRFKGVNKLKIYREFLMPFHLRNLLRYSKNQLLN